MAVVAGCLAGILACVGCGSLRAHQMQRRAAAGDDQWIVAQTVDCDTPSQACARQHLIKGAACLRVAGKGVANQSHYACAVDELGRGIALKPSWESKEEHLAMAERLCEALDGLQRGQTGPAAKETVDRLQKAAQTLYQLAPGSVPAVYYLSLAGLRQVESRLPAINAANRLPICSRLKRTVNRVLLQMETAGHGHLPAWDRFAESYQRLAFDLGAAMHAADCR